jgi:hypothetical protein
MAEWDSDLMRISRERRRMLVAVAVTAAAGGLAAGLVVANDHSDRALAQGPPQVLAQGSFRAITWNTSGTASLVREASGDLKLRLSRTFVTKAAPELFVYLVKYDGQKRTLWRNVAALRRAQGGQEYDVPADVAKIQGLSIAIYCGKCNKISALARLGPAPAT